MTRGIGPKTLALVRMIVAGQALWILLSRDPAGISALPPAVWDGVDRRLALRFLLEPGRSGLEWTLWIAAVACVSLVLAGYRTRVFGVFGGVLLYHLAPLDALLAAVGAWGKGLTIATLALPILSASACEDRWSLQAVRHAPPARDPGVFAWPVTLIRFLFAGIYLYSGVAKLATAGIGWASAATVRNHILVAGLDPALRSGASDWLVAHPGLCAALAAGILIFEVGFVLVVFVPGLRRPAVAAGLALHAGLRYTLGITFLNLPHLFLFVDLDRAPAPPSRVDI
jgi:hypothetical protein